MKRDGINFPNVPRWVYFCKDVSSETIEEVFLRLETLYKQAPKQEMMMFVSCSGGDPGQALAFYRWVKFLNIPLITVGMGEIASCGSIIFLAGKKRYILPGTHIYFHVGTSCTTDQTQRIEAKGRLKVLEHEEKQMREIIFENTSLKDVMLKKYELNSKYISDERSVELGFAQRIIGGLPLSVPGVTKRVARKPKLRLVARR